MSIDEVKQRLEYLRTEIRAERISYGEIAELQGLAEHIDRSDVELLEWAGVPESTQVAKPSLGALPDTLTDTDQCDNCGEDLWAYVDAQTDTGYKWLHGYSERLECEVSE